MLAVGAAAALPFPLGPVVVVAAHVVPVVVSGVVAGAGTPLQPLDKVTSLLGSEY